MVFYVYTHTVRVGCVALAHRWRVKYAWSDTIGWHNANAHIQSRYIVHAIILISILIFCWTVKQPVQYDLLLFHVPIFLSLAHLSHSFLFVFFLFSWSSNISSDDDDSAAAAACARAHSLPQICVRYVNASENYSLAFQIYYKSLCAFLLHGREEKKSGKGKKIHRSKTKRRHAARAGRSEKEHTQLKVGTVCTAIALDV